MDLSLRLTEENIGDTIFLETDDNFSITGEIISINETNVGIRDINTNVVLTIFLFQINEVKILKRKNVNEKKFENRIKMQKKTVGPESLINVMVDIEKLDVKKYDHPILGNLPHKENLLNFFQLDYPKKNNNINICQYLLVESRNNVYKECLSYFESSSVIGVCFYDSKVRWKHRYLIMSCSSFSVLVDLIDLDADRIKSNYGELLTLISDKKPLKIVCNAQNLFRFLYIECHTKMDHFVDLQVMYFGLHSIRTAQPMRQWLSYGAMVEAMFNVTFKLVGDAYFTTEDALHKLAYNVHFLGPIYELMMTRFMEPVEVISKRLCLKNMKDVECGNMGDEFSGCDTDASNCISVLPRGMQFWSYGGRQDDMLDVDGEAEVDVVDDSVVLVKDITRVMHHMEEEREKDVMNYWGDRIDEDINMEYCDSADILWGKEYGCNTGGLYGQLSQEVEDKMRDDSKETAPGMKNDDEEHKMQSKMGNRGEKMQDDVCVTNNLMRIMVENDGEENKMQSLDVNDIKMGNRGKKMTNNGTSRRRNQDGRCKNVLNDVSNVMRMNVGGVRDSREYDNDLYCIEDIDDDNDLGTVMSDVILGNGIRGCDKYVTNENESMTSNNEDGQWKEGGDSIDNSCTGRDSVRQYPIRLRKKYDGIMGGNDDADVTNGECIMVEGGCNVREEEDDDKGRMRDNDDDGFVCGEEAIVGSRMVGNDGDGDMLLGGIVEGEVVTKMGGRTTSLRDLDDMEEALSVLSVDVDSGCPVSCHGNSLGRGMSPVGIGRPCSNHYYCESIVARCGSVSGSSDWSAENRESRQWAPASEEVDLNEGRPNNWDRLMQAEYTEVATSKNEALGIMWSIESPATVGMAPGYGGLGRLDE